MPTPRGIITPEEARELNGNWTNKRKAANDAVADNEIDNRSSWYSIKDLRDYLDTIESDNKDVTGVRLYLGVHGNLKVGGKSTIFMVPTTPKSNPKPDEDPNTDDPQGRGLDRSDNGMPPGQGYPN